MPAPRNLIRLLVDSIADRGRTFLDRPAHSSIQKLCQDLVSEGGEASGTAIAREITDRYNGFNPGERLRFFEALLSPQWLADPNEVLQLAQQYHAHPGPAELARLFPKVEPLRQELFRRINFAPRGIEAIVNMRRDLLALLPEHPTLQPINDDLIHLLSSWFNRGFLTLRRIDWHTPAVVLEKLIAHEAVHEIHGWADLRRRLEKDRRCFAFFHPALSDEPLIFVEVALTRGVAKFIQPLIDVTAQTSDPTKADTAVFYSISNCLDGLRNISFGAFLIKQVVQEIQDETPGLKNFVTLSPAPRFREWLADQKIWRRNLPDLQTLPHIVASMPKSPKGIAERDSVKETLLRACARYLTEQRPDGRAYDPVAAFHLNNGASIEHINWMGDSSDKALRQSFGIMVNYAYRPMRIERNHEQYVKGGRFAASEEVRALLETTSASRQKS